MKNKSFWLAAGLCVLAVTGMLLALTLGRRQVQQPFTPPPFDPAACTGTPVVPPELDWQELDAKAYQVGICGVIVPNGNQVDVWLSNPEGNDVWMKVRILDKFGDILGESGLIQPGEYVQSVQLQSIPESGQEIQLKIMAYEPETYHSGGAITMNTRIS